MEAIAIIGIGCRFPGANHPEAFWHLLRNGVDAITEVPSERWDIDTLYDPKPVTPGKMNTRFGSFLEQVDLFAPRFFRISPREAERMDPQQRLILEVAWEALENAGLAPDKLAQSQTGVFMGISSYDYGVLQVKDLESINAYSGTGNAFSIAANRLSYLLDLHGPSVTIDTACSSSLVSLHYACQSLQIGESELCLVGGVNLILSPSLNIVFSQAGMMSADGRCKTFDANADGYVRGEGCGVLVLKRLWEAQRDQDNILAIIKGSAVNQDGLTNGLTAPNGLSQQRVIRQALKNAGVTPAQISYVETHGTGTPLGDPIEIRALKAVLMEGRSLEQPCYIGSVKTNIGHLEAAAGIAGLIKAVLSLQHKEITPHLHLQQLNPYISFEGTPFSIPTKRQPWIAGTEKRLAGVSSFGFGGTNCHVILEEAPAVTFSPNDLERKMHLLTLSTKSEDALQELAQSYVDFVRFHPKASLADICFTANVGRSHFNHRLAIVTESTTQLIEQLTAFTTGKQASGVINRTVEIANRPKIVFLFTGQGSQYHAMGRKLYETQPTFRKILQQCDQLLKPYLDQSLLEILYGTTETAHLLNETAYTQPALFALEYALAELWRSWGIVPDAVIGHSVGEYVAACVAGVFSLEDGLMLVAERGRLMQSLPHNGEMAVVFAEQEKVVNILTQYEKEPSGVSREISISISAVNGPNNIVISGLKEYVQSAVEQFQSQGITVKPLQVSHAFHSPLMEPILDKFESKAATVNFQAPQIALISNLTGEIFKSGEIPDASYWRRHLREPVQFAAGMNALAEQGNKVFLEIGPRPTLSGMGKRCLPKVKSIWLPSLQYGQDDWQVLLNSLGILDTQGVEVNWVGYDRDYQQHKISLPTYPFQRKRYWFESDEERNINFMDLKNSDTQLVKPQLNTVQKSIYKDKIISKLCTLVAGLLQTDSSEINVYMPFLEMGADSIVLIEAVRTIENTFGIKVTIRQMFEELKNIDSLASYIDKNQPKVAIKEKSTEPEIIAQNQPNQTIQENALEPEIAIGTLPQLSQPAPPTVAEKSTSVLESRLVNKTSVVETGLERIMAQQLQLTSQVISQQLQLLQNNRVVSSTNESQVRFITTPKPASPANNAVKGTGTQEPLNLERITAKGAEGLNSKQQQHLKALVARYTKRTQGSKRAKQSYHHVLADSRASAGFRPSIKEMVYPIVCDRSQGSKFWDVDGNEYVDITMGFGVHLFGHNPPFVIEALQEQIKLGTQLGPQSSLAGEVAKLLCELTGLERVTFCQSGTEAVMTSLRLARTATGRTKIVLFSGSYHGHFDGVLARAQASDDKQVSVPMAPGISPHIVEDVVVLDYGDPSALEYIEAHAHELAAVLVEPVQSRRPDLQPKEFLQHLRQVTAKAGTALIFDEIITGFRIHPGGAQAHFGVKADLATYGKISGGGLPFAAVAGKATLMNGIDGGQWNYGDDSYPDAERTFFAGTFNKYSLALATARAVLKHLKNQGASLQEQLNQRTAQLTKTLNAFFEQERVPIQVVYFGSLFRFSFKKNLDLFFYHLIEKGIYVWEGRTCFLSTAHTDADIQYVIQAVKESIVEMQAGGFLPKRSPNLNGSASNSPNSFLTKSSTPEAAIFPQTTTMAAGGIVEPVNVPQTFTSLTTVPDSDEVVSDAAITVSLTEAQKQLWVLAQISEEASSAHNVSINLQLRGSLNLTVLHQAVQKVVERHEGLRTTIDSQGDFQQILPFLKVDIPCINFSNVDSCERESKVADWFKQESLKPFDLTQAPLFRCYVLKLEEQLHLLVMTAHHIVVDGWSINVILQELGALYSQQCQGEVDQLKPPMQFREYINWQEQQSQTEGMAAHESYWLEKFTSSTPVLNLPTDRPRPPIKTYRGSRQTLRLNASLYREVKQFSTKKGCTPFMTLLSVYTAFLHRLTNQEDIVVSTASSGRSSAGSEKLVGYCSHLLPIRSCVAENVTFTEYLGKMKGVLLEAYEHQDYPFAWLLKQLKLGREASHSPLIATIFNLERPVAVPKMFGMETEIFAPPISFTGFDISFNVIEIGDELILNCEYNTDLFDAVTISRILGHFQTLIEGIISHPEQRLFELPLLSESEQHQLLVEWNNTQTDYPQDKCIHQLFEVQTERTPEAVAVIFEDQQLNYRELNARANQLAHHLQALKVGPEVLVGICVERSIEMVVGLLGILKAGGAYVPLDPSYPLERLSYMLADSGVEVLLTHSKLLSSLPSHTARVVCLDSDRSAIEQHQKKNLDVGVGADNLAYVIYTSGSTGLPKGVQICHHSVVNFLNSMSHFPGLTQEDTFNAVTTISFDIAALELYLPLMVGAKVIVVPREIATDADLLLSKLFESKTTAMQATPATWQMLLAGGWSSNYPLKVFCGGEALSAQLAHQILETGSELWNLYGPTEATIWSAIYQVGANKTVARNENAPYAIGRPISNTQIYILDSHLQPVSIGVPGELYIGGDGLARGYLNRPELTQEKFIANPFSQKEGARLYKTGDLARYLDDGNIEYLGRIDNQVKIRGFRIELGEIEAVLTKHPQVQEAVVIAREDTPGDKRLVAYVVSNPEQVPITSELRGFLKGKLPDYMVPSVFVMQSVLPLTPNGKLDRKVLPTPDLSTSNLEEDFVAPSTPTEQILAKIWMEILGRQQVGIYDNFFDIGGQSLLLIQVGNKVREIFSSHILVTDLFKYPTISSLAKYLSQENNVEQTALAPINELAKKQKEAIKRQKQLIKQKRKANV
ncbi:amino acid adenylation enzyme/thioester reductase family protein (plasmid) [Cylindrospermum stagnale PCC 7417]|uniref:Amino acid adenylation enzyme/thioester reductase family protein n=1 Tax=Cylindrospermum stagnale PCC 7417 TaxID=56107 RepID=K9X6F4_9NOST|nr:hybrid non-ribosomal peptide synthetase/type I polyketide synthase [Cylindrospermum stagnale]AFZ28245.1 amino acid adenylation enzyme/thioester reductase family protein [Cylindrospermum stagnale PCC 7417]